MKLSCFLFFASVILVVTSSCKKNAGPGGSSSISGVVHVSRHDGAGNLLTEYDGHEEDVYIIYGEGTTTHDDRVKTSYDGTFRFDYLEKGKYHVFAYTDSVDSPSGKGIMLSTIEIIEKKSNTVMDTIFIEK